MQMTTTLMAESEEELNSLLMKVKELSEQAGLKLDIKKLRPWHSVTSRPSWPNTWGKWKTVTDFVLLGSKITTDGDSSHEIKRFSLEEKL